MFRCEVSGQEARGEPQPLVAQRHILVDERDDLAGLTRGSRLQTEDL